jgi:glycosyltransferase involved in cell wall biosynthesis
MTELHHRYRIAMLGVRGLASSPPPQFVQDGSLAVGGAELAAEELGRHLAQRGHEVTLYTRGGKRGGVAPGFRLEPSWYLPGRRTEALSHSIWSVLRALRQRFDIVHFHAVGPGSCALLSRAAGMPSVLTVQGLDWERGKWSSVEQRLLRRLAIMGLRRADATIVVAPSLVEPVKSLGAETVACVPNGFSDVGPGDEAALARLELKPGEYLLMLSRLVPEKNIHRVISAYLQTQVSWPLVIAGGGSHTDSYVADLQKLAASSPRVRLVGVVRGAAKATLVRHAGALLNASAVEGLSLALLEALGCGVPVAVSPIPANMDVFALVPGGPTPESLVPDSETEMARVINRVVQMPSHQRLAWRAFGDRVRAAFAWDLIAERVESVYQMVLNRRVGLPTSALRPG